MDWTEHSTQKKGVRNRGFLGNGLAGLLSFNPGLPFKAKETGLPKQSLGACAGGQSTEQQPPPPPEE